MKKLCYILLTLALLLGLSTAVYAQTLPVVIDNAGLLSSAEAEQLTQQLEHLQEVCSADVVVLTVDSLDGMSAKDYADDYYDSHGYGQDGALMLVAMAEREYWVSTSGKCIDELSVDELTNEFLPDLSDGQYYDAFMMFALCCEKALYVQQESGPVITDSSGTQQQTSGMTGNTGKTVLICLGIGVVVGLIAVLVMKGQLKSVRSQHTAGNYVVSGLQLTRSADLFLYHTTTRRPKPQNNNTHSSSSGRSHGGGGGRF